jgi:N-acetylglucosaminyldiphosphoundecaprenol N-acetyl-beta-D-mannosaminyltransferase
MATDFNRDVHCLLGLPFDALGMPDAVLRVRAAALRRAPCFISTPNVNFMIGCLDDAAFRSSVLNSDLSIADGMPLVWIARLLGVPIRERVAGSDLFVHLGRDISQPLRVYFFGGMDGVAERASRILNAANGAWRCTGFDAPGFGTVEEMSTDAQIARINASGADFLLVSLGAKKGQAWIEHNRSRITVPVISHLGAVLNFIAGTVNRAPPWMQKSGLEWLWRIKEEPLLWRRYFFEGLRLLKLLLTRVLPLALHNRGWLREGERVAALATRTVGGREVIAMGGAWTASDRGRLQTAMAYAVAAGLPISFDLRELTYLDSAVLGTLMLLHGHQARRGRVLHLEGISAGARRLLRLHCAEFIFSEGTGR